MPTPVSPITTALAIFNLNKNEVIINLKTKNQTNTQPTEKCPVLWKDKQFLDKNKNENSYTKLAKGLSKWEICESRQFFALIIQIKNIFLLKTISNYRWQNYCIYVLH